MDDFRLGLMAYTWRVAVVFIFLFMVVYAARRWGRGIVGVAKEPRGRLQIVDSLTVGPQRHLHIVLVDGRRCLIGVTPQSITFLLELESGAQPIKKEDP